MMDDKIGMYWLMVANKILSHFLDNNILTQEEFNKILKNIRLEIEDMYNEKE